MGLSIVYLENKEQIIRSEKRTLLGDQEWTWQEHLEGARMRWVFKDSWDFEFHPVDNGKPTIMVTPGTSYSSYVHNLICVTMALISLKAFCR